MSEAPTKSKPRERKHRTPRRSTSVGEIPKHSNSSRASRSSRTRPARTTSLRMTRSCSNSSTSDSSTPTTSVSSRHMPARTRASGSNEQPRAPSLGPCKEEGEAPSVHQREPLAKSSSSSRDNDCDSFLPKSLEKTRSLRNAGQKSNSRRRLIPGRSRSESFRDTSPASTAPSSRSSSPAPLDNLVTPHKDSLSALSSTLETKTQPKDNASNNTAEEIPFTGCSCSDQQDATETEEGEEETPNEKLSKQEKQEPLSLKGIKATRGWDCNGCGETNKPQHHFCGLCGAAQQVDPSLWECTLCGTNDNEDSYEFCGGCGSPHAKEGDALGKSDDNELVHFATKAE